MVVILMGAAGEGAAVLAHRLAAEIGWPALEWPDLPALCASVARALGRRERLVVASRPLDEGEQRAVRGELHGVRFVKLAGQPGSPDEIVREIRRDFGL